MSAIITLDHVSYSYHEEKRPALSNINLEIFQNDWVTILGRNGSGKSTFGRLLNGLLIPTEGEVKVHHLSTSKEENVWEIRKKVGMVFQNPDHQFVASTVRDDIAFGLENIGLDRLEMVERIERYSTMIGIESLLDSEPHRLSGGQKQRVAIAGVVALQPDVIVFDEATSMLDPIGRKEVLETMKTLHENGCTIVTITHHMDEALLGNRVVVLNGGEKIADRTPQEVFQDESLLKSAGLVHPFLFQLQTMLERRGLSLAKHCMTEEELIAEIWTLLSAK